MIDTREEEVSYFTKKEEEFVNLLIELGMKKNIAKVLIFLGNIPETTSRDIERGADLRQPEVSLAMQYLMEQHWVTAHETRGERKGRPEKVYTLARPLAEIMDDFEKTAKKDAADQLAIIKKLQDFIP